MTVKDTLAARGKHYEGPGGYADTARTAQAIKEVFRSSPNWSLRNLTPVMCESLDMIANKLSRILNGNPNHADSWHDLAGYATLAEQTVQEPEPIDLSNIVVACICGWRGPMEELSATHACPMCGEPFNPIGDLR